MFKCNQKFKKLVIFLLKKIPCIVNVLQWCKKKYINLWCSDCSRKAQYSSCWDHTSDHSSSSVVWSLLDWAKCHFQELVHAAAEEWWASRLFFQAASSCWWGKGEERKIAISPLFQQQERRKRETEQILLLFKNRDVGGERILWDLFYVEIHKIILALQADMALHC